MPRVPGEAPGPDSGSWPAVLLHRPLGYEPAVSRAAQAGSAASGLAHSRSSVSWITADPTAPPARVSPPCRTLAVSRVVLTLADVTAGVNGRTCTGNVPECQAAKWWRSGGAGTMGDCYAGS